MANVVSTVLWRGFRGDLVHTLTVLTTILLIRVSEPDDVLNGGVFTLVRWWVTGVCIVLCHFNPRSLARFEKSGPLMDVALRLTMILFNPLWPVRMSAETWQTVDHVLLWLLWGINFGTWPDEKAERATTAA